MNPARSLPLHQTQVCISNFQQHTITTMPAGSRNIPQWDVVRGMLHMRLKEAAAELKVSISYLRRLCHQNGYRQWPGKEMRYMNRIGRDMMLRVDAREAAGPSQLQLAKIIETKRNQEDEDITGIHEPVANHPPRKELVTLNLIDKVGTSSSSKSN